MRSRRWCAALLAVVPACDPTCFLASFGQPCADWGPAGELPPYQCDEGYRCKSFPSTVFDRVDMCIPCDPELLGSIDGSVGTRYATDLLDRPANGIAPDDPAPTTLVVNCRWFGDQQRGDVDDRFDPRQQDVFLVETSLGSFTGRGIEAIAGNLVIVDNDMLSAVSFPDLISVGGQVVILGNHALTSIQMHDLDVLNATRVVVRDNPLIVDAGREPPPDAGGPLCDLGGETLAACPGCECGALCADADDVKGALCPLDSGVLPDAGVASDAGILDGGS